jgi:hypothetical protein
MPKAGGASIRTILKIKFGSSYRDDYDDIPLNKTASDRLQDVQEFQDKNSTLQKLKFLITNTKCIHGHFLPAKYKSLISNDKVVFVSWFRDPLERLASHYHYWQRAYNTETSAFLHRKVVEEKWSFEAFCFSPEMQNIYALFLQDFPIERFNYIGLTEYFSEDLQIFNSTYLGIDNLQIPHENLNVEKKSAYYTDPKFMSKLQAHHALDYTIYNYAVRLRSERK